MKHSKFVLLLFSFAVFAVLFNSGYLQCQEQNIENYSGGEFSLNTYEEMKELETIANGNTIRIGIIILLVIGTFLMFNAREYFGKTMVCVLFVFYLSLALITVYFTCLIIVYSRWNVILYLENVFYGVIIGILLSFLAVIISKPHKQKLHKRKEPDWVFEPEKIFHKNVSINKEPGSCVNPSVEN